MRDLSLEDHRQDHGGFSQPTTPSVEIHPFDSRDGLLVKIRPPNQPSGPTLKHIHCDIVLVIDVSSSMGNEAPVPGDTTEKTGLTILDLTKHAARTIVATLNESDFLGIVTFGSDAKAGIPNPEELKVALF